MKVSEAISAKMDEIGVTNAEMARRCEVTPQTMCGRLHDRRAMSFDMVMDMLDVLGCSLAVVQRGTVLPKSAIVVDEHSEPYMRRGEE